MGLKEELGTVFRDYSERINSRAKSAEDYEVQAKIGYLKKVLGGEKRKKSDGGFWTWDSRLQEAQRVFHGLGKYALNQDDVNALEDMFYGTIQKNRYFKTKAKETKIRGRLVNIYSNLNNYLDLNKVLDTAETPAGHDSRKAESIAYRTEKEESPAEKPKGLLARIAGGVEISLIGTAVAISLLAGGCGAAIGYNIGAKRTARVEQRVNELECQNKQYENFIASHIKKDIKTTLRNKNKKRMKRVLSTLNKVEKDIKKVIPEKIEKKETKTDYKPQIEESRKEEDITSSPQPAIKGTTGNIRIAKNAKTNNNVLWGNRGYVSSNNVPEFSEEKLKERKEFRKRVAAVRRKERRSKNMLESGFYNVFTLKHPFKGIFQIIGGAGGVINTAAHDIFRAPIYGITKSDCLDRGVNSLISASYFGDRYNRLHSRKFSQQLKEHPVESGISIIEDIFWIRWLKKHHKESGTCSRGNPPGRSGGPGAPGGRGGGAGTP